MKALKKMTGNTKLMMLMAFHNPPFEQTGGGSHWADLGQGNDQDKGSCLGIRCNIWVSALQYLGRREITHHFRGGGNNNIGWGALRWQEMVGTNEVLLGQAQLAALPPTKKFQIPPRVSRLLLS